MNHRRFVPDKLHAAIPLILALIVSGCDDPRLFPGFILQVSDTGTATQTHQENSCLAEFVDPVDKAGIGSREYDHAISLMFGAYVESATSRLDDEAIDSICSMLLEVPRDQLLTHSVGRIAKILRYSIDDISTDQTPQMHDIHTLKTYISLEKCEDKRNYIFSVLDAMIGKFERICYRV